MAFGGSGGGMMPFGGGGGGQGGMGASGMVPFSGGAGRSAKMASNPNKMAGIMKLLAMRRMGHGAAGMPGGMQTMLPRIP